MLFINSVSKLQSRIQLKSGCIGAHPFAHVHRWGIEDVISASLQLKVLQKEGKCVIPFPRLAQELEIC